MIRHRILVVISLTGLILAAGILGHGRGNAETPAPRSNEVASTAALGGVDRYLTAVSTDKPIYRPGESLRVRGVLLHHATHQPATQPQTAVVQITGPKGDQVASGSANSENSVWGFEWTIPESQPGGEYTINVTYPLQGQPPAERKFDIRAYRSPRLNNQVKFLRDGYGPSDQVVATLRTVRAEGGVPAGAAVTVVARVDGVEIYRGGTRVDEQGNCLARFELPNVMQRGEGTLAMIIDDGGHVETASKTIPILLQTVDLQLYPEGGELVAGLENRVYFEAFTPAQKPADLAGVVLDQSGEQVTTFRSEHEGRGRFTFTPTQGSSYFLRIDEPSGMDSKYELPDVIDNGVTLSSTDEVMRPDQPVNFRIAATNSGKYTLTVRQRESVLDTKQLDLKAGVSIAVELDASTSDGVLIVTLANQDGLPLAERLVFRQPSQQLNLRIEPSQSQYVPGDKAAITIIATDADGKPVSANVGLTVTDESVLEMLEQRDQAPTLPVMVLLENDVREIADAHVYLDADNPQAPLAVDLLLGTQGWRRFAFFRLPDFLKEHTNAATRTLALKVPAQQNLVRFGRLDEGGDFAEGLELQELKAEDDRAVKGVRRFLELKAFRAKAPALDRQPAADDENERFDVDKDARNRGGIVGRCDISMRPG